MGGAATAARDEQRGCAVASLFKPLAPHMGGGHAEIGEHAYAHPLDGDGYVLAFSFNADGRVHFRSRFVRTGRAIASARPANVDHALSPVIR